MEETYEAIQLVGTSSVKEARADESSLQLELLVVNPETKLARENCCVFKLRSAKVFSRKFVGDLSYLNNS